jgi:hypothetical protein
MHVLLRAGDMLSDLVACARDGRAARGQPAWHQLLAELDALADGGGSENDAPFEFVPTVLSVEPIGVSTEGGGIQQVDMAPDEPTVSTWKIAFAPSGELYGTGNEPLALLRALEQLGELTVDVRRRGRSPARGVRPGAAPPALGTLTLAFHRQLATRSKPSSNSWPMLRTLSLDTDRRSRGIACGTGPIGRPSNPRTHPQRRTFRLISGLIEGAVLNPAIGNGSQTAPGGGRRAGIRNRHDRQHPLHRSRAGTRAATRTVSGFRDPGDDPGEPRPRGPSHQPDRRTRHHGGYAVPSRRKRGPRLRQ